MMLNWKSMPLGFHARVTVRGPREFSDMVHGQKTAQVDVRWDGSELTVLGSGGLWPQVEEVLNSGFSQARQVDGVWHFSYGDCADRSTAMRDFEARLREMTRAPGWTVEEVQL